MRQRLRRVAGAGLAALISGAAVQAAEGFQVRYNLAGTMAVEMFAPAELQGWAGSIIRSDARVEKVTGPDGGPLAAVNPQGLAQVTVPGVGTVPVSYASSLAYLYSQGRLTQYNALLAYITPDTFSGGRLALAANIPYVTKKTQASSITAATPAATFAGGPLSGQTLAGTPQALFSAAYQDSLATRAVADSGEVQGVGDIELQAGWLRREQHLRVLLGLSLVLPTGGYNPAAGPDVSLGKFYTLRPAAQVVWLPTPDWSVGGRLTYGVSSRNQDSQVRSGNWVSMEVAAGRRTAYGVVGLHTVMVRQIQDDSGGPWGGNRIRSDNVGAYYTAPIAPLDASLSIQYMKTIESRNAKHGDYLQVRLSKAF